jgi:hypothetical protein
VHLVGAPLMEPDDEYVIEKRYMSLESKITMTENSAPSGYPLNWN